LNFKIDEDKLYFLDENNKELEITTKGNEITIKDKKYAGYKITIAESYPGVSVTRVSRVFNFYFTNEGVKMLGSGGRVTKPIVADTFKPLDGFEKIASDRGYIWGRTIPLLKNYVVYGSGPDNYPIAFPQDDFLAKSNVFSDLNTVVDKPHNWYLQIAANTGVLSLLSILLIVGIYIINSLKLFTRMNYDSLDKYIGASCLVGVIGYLAASVFNDSVISVAPVFWILLGLGISINYRLRIENS
jgi:hypothetical protein